MTVALAADDRAPVARLFQRSLAVTFLVAWASLGVQIDVLIGSHGLLPAKDLVERIAARPDITFLDAPTLLRFDASDAALHMGIAAGIGFALLALLGVMPRLAFAATTLLYLGYAVVARSFLGFQWDNLLLECGALGALLSARKPQRWVWFLLRVALFKLYFESGLAKLGSPLGDWKDGSAMAYYYETAPIPTWIAWYAHHLPAAWHALESHATLVFELGVPFLIFLPRPGRLIAVVVFTGFQLLNIATANYGFFSYLALVLGMTLLDGKDVKRLARPFAPLLRRTRRARARFRLAKRRAARPFAQLVRRAVTEKTATPLRIARLTFAVVITSVYVAVSYEEAVQTFFPAAPRSAIATSIMEDIYSLRLVNTYHLFAQITRERIEPTFETLEGEKWTEHDLHYKPGDPERAPPFVAPHQPRVDFLLWFYGLGYERSVPEYVGTLLEKLCTDPSSVASLFVGPLPASPDAARVEFFQYHFTTPEQRRRTGAWWTREPIGTPRTLPCSAVLSDARTP